MEEARQILSQVEQGVRVAQRASRGEIGRLVVGFEGSSTYDVIPVSLKVYRERFPEVDLVVYASDYRGANTGSTTKPHWNRICCIAS